MSAEQASSGGGAAAHAAEIAAGERYGFGRNWRSFLELLDEERIVAAEESLRRMLEVSDLAGRSFLDIGNGSGLFSLAARRLGARVHSFDYDPDSVGCAQELRRRYFPEDDGWQVEQGSVLDRAYVASLGTFDIVYSWGVLHHTGAMWTAMDHAALPVARGGRLFVALYNDQGVQSEVWKRIKRTYCSGLVGRTVVTAAATPVFVAGWAAADVLRGHSPLTRYTGQLGRGMSLVHDLHDWLGGYPFEVASPEAVLDFYRGRGFHLDRLKTARGRSGNNEFVFTRA